MLKIIKKTKKKVEQGLFNTLGQIVKNVRKVYRFFKLGNVGKDGEKLVGALFFY
jgi:hypothetical protein